MMPIKTYDELIKYYLNEKEKRKFVSCILFLNPNRRSVDVVTRILDNIEYFHKASGELITFFIPGYYHQMFENREYIQYFEISSFISFFKDIEKRTTWRYSGETELLFYNFSQNDIDFSRVYNYKIEEMITCGALKSFEGFFENLRISLEESGSPCLGIKATKKMLIASLSTIMDIFKQRCENFSKLKNASYFLPHNFQKDL